MRPATAALTALAITGTGCGGEIEPESPLLHWYVFRQGSVGLSLDPSRIHLYDLEGRRIRLDGQRIQEKGDR